MNCLNLKPIQRMVIVPAVLLLLASLFGPQLRAEQAALKAFETVELSSEIGRSLDRMQIQAFGRNFQLDLAPNQALLASLPSRQRDRIAAEDVFLKGSIEGIPGSWVRLNRIDGRFSGGFFDGSELYLIDRAAGFPGLRAAGVPRDQTIAFRFADLEFDALIDRGGVEPLARSGTSRSQTDYADFISHLREIASLQGTVMLALPVTIVSDVQFTARHGSSAASVVAGRINFIDGIYSTQVGVGITLWHHEILSANGTLTATGALELLNQFRAFMTTGAGSDVPFLGVAHLFTDGRPQGGTAGIAYVGVLCNPGFGYGVDEDLNSETTTALVFAHEVGHNFGAPHDGENECADETFRGIMNPSINQSQQFSDCSIEEMSAELNGAGCLVEPIEPEEVFRNGFESPAG